MDLTPYVSALREDLLTAAAVGNEDTRQAATLLAGAIEPAARLALMNALSDLAAEVTGALQGRTVDLHLDGRNVRVRVTEHPHAGSAGTAGEVPRGVEAEDAATSPDDLRRSLHDVGGELSRTTVRLFQELKSQAERAAGDQGVSLNTYISRAVADSVRSAVPGKGHREHTGTQPGGSTVTGFVQG
jgi:hypothetical protein